MKKIAVFITFIILTIILTSCTTIELENRDATKACVSECKTLAEYEDQIKESKPENYHIIAATCRKDITNQEINTMFEGMGAAGLNKQKYSCKNDEVCDCIFEDETSTTDMFLEAIQVNVPTE